MTSKPSERVLARLRTTRAGQLFLNRKFATYTWIGVFISLLNVFFLWLFIDVAGIGTIISSILVVGGTFILRYVLFDVFKIL